MIKKPDARLFPPSSTPVTLIVDWMKTNGGTYTYDKIIGEIKARWPHLSKREADFIFKKVIRIVAA